MTRTTLRLLLSASIALELLGFWFILQTRAVDGILLVLFGLTFCMMTVFFAPAEIAETGCKNEDASVDPHLLNAILRERLRETQKPRTARHVRKSTQNQTQ